MLIVHYNERTFVAVITTSLEKSTPHPMFKQIFSVTISRNMHAHTTVIVCIVKHRRRRKKAKLALFADDNGNEWVDFSLTSDNKNKQRCVPVFDQRKWRNRIIESCATSKFNKTNFSSTFSTEMLNYRTKVVCYIFSDWLCTSRVILW